MQVGHYTTSLIVSALTADNGPMSVAVALDVLPSNSPPGTPTPVSPGHLTDITDPNPELTVQNTVDPDGDTLTYDFEVYVANTNTIYYAVSDAVEGIGFTSIVITKTLDVPASYQWRARAVDERGAAGPWTELQLFSVLEPGSSGGCSSAAGGARGGSLGAWLLAGLLLVLRRRRSDQ